MTKTEYRLAEVWGSRHPHALLMGVSAGSAALDGDQAKPSKTENTHTRSLNISTARNLLWIYSRHTKCMCTRMFIKECGKTKQLKIT